MNRRVVVTGVGVVTGNALGKDAFVEALRQGQSGIRAIPRLGELNFACRVGVVPQGIDKIVGSYLTQDHLYGMNESMIYAAIAGIEAMRDANLPPKPLDCQEVYEETGAIIGTGIGGMDTLTEKLVPAVSQGKVRRMGSAMVEQIMASSCSAKLGGLLGLGNQVTTNSSACSTGTEAVIMGLDRIRQGKADRMLVGGSEGTCPYTWSGFDSMRVLSSQWNDQPEKASRPMSASACGFVPAGGAGVLVLEELQTARKRGAKIYAEVRGGAITCGGMRLGGSMTAPSPTGVKRCIRMALKDAQVEPGEIDYINGHLTATIADGLEVSNWAQALERQGDNFPWINSTKSMLGHALGAAGAIECIATLLQMNHGFLHPSLNCDDLHEDVARWCADKVVRQTLERRIDVAAKASFGFGDVNACVLFARIGQED